MKRPWKRSRGNQLALMLAVLYIFLFGAMLFIHFLQPEGRTTPVPQAQQRQRSQ